MSISIKNLTVRNFLSVGNATQALDFNRNDLTLVLGENLDLGGNGSRNSVGKTAIINALSYALYGQALTNIKRDNLINKTNSKNMLVSLDFNVNGQEYRVERGRKPNILKLYVNHQEQEIAEDTSQGDSRETQDAIERILGLSHNMFKHILALNTYTEPFLSLKSNDQRDIIEQLLGITLLSERAEKIKELNRVVKDGVSQEEYRIKAVIEANQRIEDQIASLKRKQTIWLDKKSTDCNSLRTAINSLSGIDIVSEIQAHKDLEIFYQKQTLINDANRWIKSISTDDAKLTKQATHLKKEIEQLDNHCCYACGQSIHDTKQDEIKQAKQAQLQEVVVHLLANETQLLENQTTIQSVGDLGTVPSVFYDTLELALDHKNSLTSLNIELERREADQDIYGEQVEEMQHQALQVVDYSEINHLTKMLSHQEFLLKLLTNKDSFIRKKIIDQNLSYLNNRLTHYLARVGLPHQVVFQNDLTVEITELGRDLDFHNLSRGEMTRLVLSLSWAFRDVWESLYSPINVLFIDELIDSGMDTNGAESVLGILKHMAREHNKSIWLVSHKDDLIGRVENVLKVVKSNGFTEFGTDIT